MGKKQRKKLARQIVKQVLRELGKMPAPAPAPAKKTPKQQAAEILTALREHAATSARLAGFDPSAGEMLLSAGLTPAQVARAFNNALQVVQ
jgi:hypothetical protein